MDSKKNRQRPESESADHPVAQCLLLLGLREWVCENGEDNRVVRTEDPL